MHHEHSPTTQKSTLSFQPSILIVGAGLSGLSAARHLVEQGFSNVTIFEASDRVGGRIQSISFAGNVIELGAQWLHGLKGNPLARQLVADGLLTAEALEDAVQDESFPWEEFHFFNANGKPLDQKKAVDMFKRLEHIFSEVGTKPPLLPIEVGDNFLERDSLGLRFQEAIESHLLNKLHSEEEKELLTSILRAFKNYYRFVEGTDDLGKVSLRGRFWFEGEVGGVMERFLPGGVSDIIRHWVEKVGAWRIKLGYEVTRVVRDDTLGRVRVQYRDCNSGALLCRDFNHVVVTCSLNFLKAHHRELFHPPLPLEKVNALSEVQLGKVEKVFLELDRSVYPTSVAPRLGFFLLTKDEEEDPLLRDLGDFFVLDNSGRQFMTVFYGEAARQATQLPRDTVRAILQAYLRRHLRQPVKILQIQMSGWTRNPHVLGSYTFVRPGAGDTVFHRINQPLYGSERQPLVMFAGEHTHPTFYSCMQGAFESGQREAKRICGFYAKCPSGGNTTLKPRL